VNTDAELARVARTDEAMIWEPDGYADYAVQGWPLALEVIKAVQGLGRMACVTIPDGLTFPSQAAWNAAQCRECAVCVLNKALTDWIVA
jgi:hypothetical protein